MAAVIKIEVHTVGGVDQVKKDIADLGDTAQKSGGGFSAMQEIATGALRAIGAAAVSLAAEGLAQVGKFLVDSIGVAGDFQAKMNEVGAALGKGFEPGTVALDQFKDLFISLGKELPVSTAEVQDAALALIKGGLDPAVVSAGALKDSLNFAAAAGMGLADAAELTIKQLGTFVPLGASVEEQTRFMANAQNLLVKAAGASTLDVDKLGAAMLQAGGAAKASGVEYQDFVTVMGLISPSFGSAEQAGTSYKNFLSRLIPTTDDATAWMIDLGLATDDGTSKFYDANGAFIGNAAAAQLLNETMSGLSDATRAEAMSTIFGNDAKGAAIALMDAGAAGYENFAAKMNEANGVQQQAEAVQQGFNFQLENMKGSLEALQITIGTALLPVLAQLIGDYITPGINAIMEFADGFIQSGQAGAMLAGVMGTLTGVWQTIEPVVTATVPLFTGQLPAALLTTGETFTQLQSTIGTVMAGIQAVVGAVLPQIAAFWQAHGAEIMAFVQEAWARIQTIIQTALQLIQAIVGPALQAIASFISAHGTEIQALLTNTWNAIKAIVDAALTLIQGVLKAALQIIQGDWSGAWNTIQQMSARIVQDIITVIQSGIGNIVTLFGGLVEQVISTLSALPAQAAAIGKDIISGIISGVESAAGQLYDMLKGMAIDALGAAKRALGISSPSAVFADEVGAPIIQGLIEGVQGMLPGLTDMLSTVAVSILSHVKKVTEKVVDEANKIQDELIKQAEGIADKLSGVMADALMGTASLDRAKAKAIGALKDISAAQQEEVQKQLAAAAQTAGGFGDPKQAAAFFKQRSDQIFELAKLRDQIEKTTDEAAKARLIEQYNLIGKAQQAELQAFDVKGGSTTLQAITAQLQKILGDRNLPGVLEDQSGVLGQLFAALPQLVAMTTTPGPSAASSVSSSSFTYAPTISTTGHVSAPMDLALATSLAGV